MSQVWEMEMDTSKKLVLLAICDWSNDSGFCFPSMTSIARRTCISIRQCQRIMSDLMSKNIIAVIENQKGGAKSKRYQINIDALRRGDPCCTGDKMSPVTSASRPPVTPASVTGDADVTRTITNHQIKPPLLHDKFGELDWTFLSTLLNEERVVVVNFLCNVDKRLQQDLLDELAGALRSNSIKGQWPAWLRAVVRRAQNDAFVPNHALQIRRDRQHRVVLADEDAIRRDRQRLEAERRNDPVARARSTEAMIAAIATLNGLKI